MDNLLLADYGVTTKKTGQNNAELKPKGGDMLKVYGAKWCPHCVDTVAHLEKKNIEFKYIDIESQPDPVVQKIVDVNGGDDWVVPTLEFNGRFREGKVYNPVELDRDLKAMGVME